MFHSSEITDVINCLGITHVVWIPDSTLGAWDEAFCRLESVNVVRVCREGEAWAVAAGLHIGGARPLVMMQCTGWFESGDAFRNIVHDYEIPVLGIIGFRNYLNRDKQCSDSCLEFTEPIAAAWNVDYLLIERPDQLGDLSRHLSVCQEQKRCGLILLAEGKG